MGNSLSSWKSWVIGLALIIIVAWVFTTWKESFQPILSGLKRDGYDIPLLSPSDVAPEVIPIQVKQQLDRSAYQHIMPSSRDCTPRYNDLQTGVIDNTPPLPADITSQDWEDNSKRSKGEKECQRVMEKIYGVPFTKANPKVKTEHGVTLPWLKNDLPGGRLMEIDVYNHELKIGVEYMGEQHYKFPHHFNKDLQAFRNQFYRDELKLTLCDANGVYLITVPYNVKIQDIEGFIRYYLPDAVMARQKRMELLR